MADNRSHRLAVLIDADNASARIVDGLFDEIAKLGNAGLRAVPSQANFVLVVFEGELTAEVAYKGLMDAGYIVRWLPGQGLPHGLRITIGTEDETKGVVAALRQLAGA